MKKFNYKKSSMYLYGLYFSELGKFLLNENSTIDELADINHKYSKSLGKEAIISIIPKSNKSK